MIVCLQNKIYINYRVSLYDIQMLTNITSRELTNNEPRKRTKVSLRTPVKFKKNIILVYINKKD